MKDNGKNWAARISCAVFADVTVLALAWLSGFNFTERGMVACFTGMVFLWAAIAGITCPLFDD